MKNHAVGTHKLAINRAFLSQRVTGQQRYATEVAKRLLADASYARAIDPPEQIRGNRFREWIWVQGPGVRAQRGEKLLSLTSRAPIVRARHIVVVHDLFVLTNPQWFSPIYARSHGPVLRAQLATAAACVAVSEPTAQAVRAVVGAKVPVVVAPNGVTTVFATADDDRTLSHATLSRHRLRRKSYFLSVGSLEPRKNLTRLAKAYSALAPGVRHRYPLLLAGLGADVFRKRAYEWPEGVKLLGYVPDEDLRILYENCLATIVPSLDEGFGLPLIEAAAACAPLLLSDIPTFRWVYGDGAKYFDPLTEADMVTALEETIRDETIPSYAQLKTKAIEIQTRFDWDATAAAIKRLVEEMN